MSADGAASRSSLRFVMRTLAANQELRRVQAAFVTHNCGEYASWIAMLVFAYAQGGVVESGIVATVMLVPAALLAPAIASLSQRFALGASLFAAYVAQAVTNAAVAVALFADAPNAVVYAALVGPAVAFTATRPAQSALTPALARTPDELTASNVVSGWIESASIFAAPALTGIVLAIGSDAMVFAAVALACLAGAVLVAPLRGAGAIPEVDEGGDDGEGLASSLAFVREDGSARLLLLLLAAEGVAIGALDVLTVELAQGGLDLGADWVGYLTAAFGLGGVLAVGVTAGLVGRARLAPPLVVALVVWGVAFLGLAVVPGAAAALILLTVAGGARSAFDVAGRTLLQRVARPDLLSRVFGLLEGAQMAALALGSLLAPLLVWLGGLTLAFACVAAMLPLFAVAAGRRLLDIDRHATVPVVEISLLRSLPLFSALAPPTLESLARGLQPLAVMAGTEVMREGEAGDHFYVIADGELEVVRGGQIVATRGRGEAVGEIALMYDVPRTATVRARTDTRLLALERELFLVAVTGHAKAHRAARDLADARLADLGSLDEGLAGQS